MSHETVQELFSQAAARFGPQVAIDRMDRRITYAQLETQSNRLANFLLEHGVQRGSMVGLLAGDPIQIVTGILGVLKAGAIFVPLDPNFPDQRLEVMVNQVNANWYVIEEKYRNKLRSLRFSATAEAKVVCIDEGTDGFERYERTEHPNVRVDREAPCSVYFTSGSSGKPKAILGQLKGIDHYVRWEIEALDVGPGTRVSQLASPSFDGFLKDTFVPLCAGGVICAPESREIILDAQRLVDWLDIEQVEVLHCVPSMFRALLNAGLNDNYFPAMKYVVLAGEPLLPADVRRWLDVFGERIQLVNLYGPTETTILKVFHFVKPEDIERPSIPLGKPIKGAAVMVINSRGQLCRDDAIGEIYIRTPYRSLGYYGQPELTKEVFIQNPFSDDPNDIVYKTGDFGRFMEDKTLEFLGRRDQQVKVRGVRIELGEIENLLREHEAIADVAVVDRDDGEGNKFLVAYVSMSNGNGSEGLRQYLAARLPETMVPSAFVELNQLPRTLNGKIDRKALPALELRKGEREKEALATLTPVEEIVAGIWCEVLRLPSVGRHENFFNLGGHSLLMTQVLSRIREYLKVELTIRAMFEAATVAEMSHLIDTEINAGKQHEELPKITPVSRDGELPLSYSQQRMWFFEQLASGTSAFHIVLGVRLGGELNTAALEQTLSEIMRRHESLRTVFTAVNQQPVQIIKPPITFRLPLIDLNGLREEERERQAARLAQAQTVQQFDLATGPLARIALLRMSPREHILIATLHHIIGDEQSLEVITVELSRLYEAFTSGQQSPLPELTVQYVDYAAWQRQWLQGEVLENRLAYWRKQLQDAPRGLSLPRRRVRPKVQGFKGVKHSIKISNEQTEALREFSRREGLTLFMTILSGFILLLKYYTGDEDILVGSVHANRELAETERLIGILANPLVLRVDLSAALTFSDVLQCVREVCLDAYTYQVPPELLREDLIKRGDERERLFDIWFQLGKENKEKLDLQNLETSWFSEGKEDSRFELSLALGERDKEIVGVLEFDEALFTERTTAQMLEDYVGLLTSIVADPERRLSTFSLTREHEIEQLSAAFVANLEV